LPRSGTSADFWYGWWYAGFGQRGTGSADLLLGVRERNVGGGYVSSCPPGPYHFQPGCVDQQCDLFHFWRLHPGGAHFLYADGSVHFLTYEADRVLPALATRAGGEVVELPDAPIAQLFRSISDCVLTTVYSLGNVWNEYKHRHPGRASAVMKPSGATPKRLWEGKWCSRPRLPPSAISSS